VTVLEAVTRYFAVSIARLLALMREAGFTDCRRLDEIMYQPVLVGRTRSSAQNGARPARV